MAYRVTAPGGVFCMLPTAMFSGKRQVHQNFRFPKGATLPAEVKPEAIATLLSNGMIEEVTN
jgi:hypothetical protein